MNTGILRGFEHGLLTSTSLLANGPACQEAAQLWKRLQQDHAAGLLPSSLWRGQLEDPAQAFDLGVHLNLTQGRPLTPGYPAQLLDRDGRFPGIFELSFRLWTAGGRFHDALREELHEQAACLRDHGLELTHVNGHQYVEMLPAVSGLLPDLMQRFGIRVCRLARERPGPAPFAPWNWPAWGLAKIKRHFADEFGIRLARAEILHSDGFRGASHAGRVDFAVLQQFLATLHGGLTEIALHPAVATSIYVPSDGWTDPLAHLRPQELAWLTSEDLVELLLRENVGLGRLLDVVPSAASPSTCVA